MGSKNIITEQTPWLELNFLNIRWCKGWEQSSSVPDFIQPAILLNPCRAVQKVACEPRGIKNHGKVGRWPLLSTGWETAVSFSFTVKEGSHAKFNGHLHRWCPPSPHICSCCSLCLNARNLLVIKVLGHLLLGERTVTHSARVTGVGDQSPDSTSIMGGPYGAGEHTRLPALQREMLIRHDICNSTVSNAVISGGAPLHWESPFPADSNEANKEIYSTFQNTFTWVKFFPQQEETTSSTLGAVPTPWEKRFNPCNFHANRLLLPQKC